MVAMLAGGILLNPFTVWNTSDQILKSVGIQLRLFMHLLKINIKICVTVSIRKWYVRNALKFN